jgi:hypothetical protein
MHPIELAQDILDENEFLLAQYLEELLNEPRCKFRYFLFEDILPVYSEKKDGIARTLCPDPIYRPLYYIHSYSIMNEFDMFTRSFVAMTGAHIEGCLLWLTRNPPQFRAPTKPFGGLVKILFQAGILSEKLAFSLFRFNEVANIPAKHFGASNKRGIPIDQRSFSVFEAVLDFVMMRNLSIQLFKVLQNSGIVLPHGWKDFDNDWLSKKWSHHVSE